MHNDEDEHTHGHGAGNESGAAHRRHGFGHHHHHHHHPHTAASNIRTALFLNLVFSLIEFGGGLWTGSVAILSDAVHDFGDALALGLAYFLERMAGRGSTSTFSYGYRRMSLLSAVLTCGFLVGGSIYIFVEAVPRLLNPVQPHTKGMFGFALLGIAVNSYSAWRTSRGKTLNEKVVSWHFVEDILGWVAVLIGALVMSVADLPIIDPILSIVFTGFILFGVVRNLAGTLRLFMQGTPREIDLLDLRQDIEKLEGVVGTHDAHLWSLDGQAHVLTMHVVVRSESTLGLMEEIKGHIRSLVAKRGQIHVTMELESETEVCPDFNCIPERSL